MNLPKERFRMKDSYDWIREELVIMKSSESAMMESLEEACEGGTGVVRHSYKVFGILRIDARSHGYSSYSGQWRRRVSSCVT